MVCVFQVEGTWLLGENLVCTSINVTLRHFIKIVVQRRGSNWWPSLGSRKACFSKHATRIAERQGSDDLVCPAGAAEWASGVHARERAVFEFNLPVHENGIDPFG